MSIWADCLRQSKCALVFCSLHATKIAAWDVLVQCEPKCVNAANTSNGAVRDVDSARWTKSDKIFLFQAAIWLIQSVCIVCKLKRRHYRLAIHTHAPTSIQEPLVRTHSVAFAAMPRNTSSSIMLHRRKCAHTNASDVPSYEIHCFHITSFCSSPYRMDNRQWWIRTEAKRIAKQFTVHQSQRRWFFNAYIFSQKFVSSSKRIGTFYFCHLFVTSAFVSLLFVRLSFKKIVCLHLVLSIHFNRPTSILKIFRERMYSLAAGSKPLVVDSIFQS